jgi:hypothetical protein
MRHSHPLGSLFALLVVACEGAAAPPPGADAASDAGVALPGDDAGSPDVDASTPPIDGDAGHDAGGSSLPCRADDDGRLGAPRTTFEIPSSAIRAGGLYVRDVQAAFPAAGWSTLDRLYIPAGTYTLIYLGNLPQRSADRPLVITNRGGQVHVVADRYALALKGGSNWVLTGRYDPVSETGDPAFPGHRGCDYAASRGRYGIHLDGTFGTGGAVLGVGSPGGTEPGAGTNVSTDFEIEYVEIERASFAGLMIKSDDQGESHMRNVRVHDLYIHDTISEGCYIGSTQAEPQHRIELAFHHNRLVRAGTECGQFGQLARGSEIHHNVFALCAIDWRDSFQPWQDNGVQLGVRQGDASFHHNVVIGAAGNLLSMFDQPRTGDDHSADDVVALHDNHLEATRGNVMWLHDASDGVTRWAFDRMTVRERTFGRDEVYPTARPEDSVFRTTNDATPITFADVVWDEETVPVSRFTPSTQPTITVASSVRAGSVAPIAFRDFLPLPEGTSWLDVEMWTDVAGRAPDVPPVTYAPGDVVVHDGVVYECLRASTAEPPPDHPAAWRRLGVPVDDVRAVPGSRYEALGLGGG